MTNAKDQIIQTTCSLLEKQGYHATGLNQIVSESGAPKGSLYYYFPEGKEQITAEAIAFAGQMIADRIRAGLHEVDDAAEAVRLFVRTIAQHVEISDFAAGGPLQTVALETAAGSERINLACRTAYDQVQAAFHDRLSEAGFPAEKAAALARFITASIEGAVILSRTYHTGDPLREAGEKLAQLIQLERKSI